MITTFQLRSARSVTGVRLDELTTYLGVSKAAISRWENQDTFKTISTKNAKLGSIIFFFEQYNIFFPDENSIQLGKNLTIADNFHLTRFQLRAARSALGLTQEHLANELKVQKSVVNYLEIQRNDCLLNTTKKEINDLMFKDFFEQKGIVFSNNFKVFLTK